MRLLIVPAETLEHVLIYCTAYENERVFLLEECERGIGNLTLKLLLHNGLNHDRIIH